MTDDARLLALAMQLGIYHNALASRLRRLVGSENEGAMLSALHEAEAVLEMKAEAWRAEARNPHTGRWIDGSGGANGRRQRRDTFSERMAGGPAQTPGDLQRGHEVTVGPKEIRRAKELGMKDPSYAREAATAYNTSQARQAMVRMAMDVLGISHEPTDEQVDKLADAYHEGVASQTRRGT